MARFAEDADRMTRGMVRARRHVQWIREQGLARVIEEDRLQPVVRARAAASRALWRRRHGVAPGEARPVYVLGVQRSGTNMVMAAFEVAPAFEIRNENDKTVFERFQLRSLESVTDVVGRSRHEFVVLKPLCDSDRAVELLELDPGRARALWVYRAVDDRVRSAVSKFGDVNAEVLREIAREGRSERWQARSLSDDSLDKIRAVAADLDAESGAALFWYARNRLFLDQGLQDRDDVLLVSYDRLVDDPRATFGAIADLLGIPYTESLVAHVEAGRSSTRAPLDLHPDVRRWCTELQGELDDLAARRTDPHR